MIIEIFAATAAGIAISVFVGVILGITLLLITKD